MKLLALDPGTNKLGLAVFEDGILILTHCINATASKHRYERTQEILKNLMKFLEEGNLFDWNRIKGHEVVCEEPMLQGKSNTSMQRLLGCLEFLFIPKINYVHPSTVKKFCGKGSLDKLEVALAAGEMLKTEEERELLADALAREAWDETDAVAIGLTHLRREA